MAVEVVGEYHCVSITSLARTLLYVTPRLVITTGRAASPLYTDCILTGAAAAGGLLRCTTVHSHVTMHQQTSLTNTVPRLTNESVQSLVKQGLNYLK